MLILHFAGFVVRRLSACTSVHQRACDYPERPALLDVWTQIRQDCSKRQSFCLNLKSTRNHQSKTQYDIQRAIGSTYSVSSDE